MKSILEEAIVHLLNEEPEKAEALFHKFMIRRARSIHESLRQGEDAVLSEGWDDEINSEEYFSSDDLSSLEDTEGAGEGEDPAELSGDELSGDTDPDMDAMGPEEAGDELDAGADLDGLEDGSEPTGDLSDTMTDVKDALADLTAEFERLMSEIDGGDESLDAEAPVDEPVDAAADETIEGDEDAETFDEPKPEDEDAMEESDEMGEDPDLEDITESVLADLEKIVANITDGKEVGDGPKISTNNKSSLTMDPVNKRDGAKPIVMKSVNHTGFERETAPTVAAIKTGSRNAKKPGQALTQPTSGDKSAMLNKDFAGGPKPSKSPIDGK